MIGSQFINDSYATRVLNRKSTVIHLYPELERLYSKTSSCVKCKKKNIGRAILLHILNDPLLKYKDKKALEQLFPAAFVAKLGG